MQASLCVFSCAATQVARAATDQVRHWKTKWRTVREEPWWSHELEPHLRWFWYASPSVLIGFVLVFV